MNDHNNPTHLLFLSHSKADADAARALIKRIESTPEARERGLKVWFDETHLLPGQPWKPQIEDAIEKQATAFAVYVGTRGIVNWVEDEVHVALDRARAARTKGEQFPFIPILSVDATGAADLPGFSRQYQSVSDVESDAEQFSRLIRAALGTDRTTEIHLVDEPFLGLRAFTESDSHLFFGREKESDELLERLREDRLLIVVGDSGSGKSSLVKAGLVSRFRGGKLSDPPCTTAR